MRVLLTTLNAKYIHVNLALRYLRACCRDLPLELPLTEFTINDRPENIAAAIYRLRPDLVAFSCYIWNIEPTLAVAEILKAVKPDLPVLCGGPEVSFATEAFLTQHPQVDMVITGEGEVPFRALLEQLAEGRFNLKHLSGPADKLLTPAGLQERLEPELLPAPADKLRPTRAASRERFNPGHLSSLAHRRVGKVSPGLSDPAAVPGLAWRRDGQVIVNPPAPPLRDLDRIPFPYQEDLASGGGDLQQRTVYYETSRGCPFACGFCLSSTTAGLRYFSLERVKSDLERLLAAGVREIKFVDRTFNAHKRRALAIWKFLVSLRPQARFYFEIAGDRLDEEMLAFLSQVPPGLFQFEIGVQTIDAEVNKLCNRRQNWPRLAANIRRLQATGNLRLHLDLIAGLPGETYAGVAGSLDAVTALKPHEIQLGFLKLLKGTSLRARAGEFGYRFLDRPPYEVLASHTIAYEEMLRLHDVETLLRYYGNSHLADHALAYLAAAAFGGSYFAVYEALAAWWEARGLLRRSHSQRDLFNHLAAFAAGLTGENFNRVAVPPVQHNHRSSATGREDGKNANAGLAAKVRPAGPGEAPLEEPAGKLNPGQPFTAGPVWPECFYPLTAEQLARFYQLLKFDFLCRDRSRCWPDWVPPSPLSGDERAAYLTQVTSPGFMEKYMPGLSYESPASLRRHGFIEVFPCHPEQPEQARPTFVYFYYGPQGSRAEVYFLTATYPEGGR